MADESREARDEQLDPDLLVLDEGDEERLLDDLSLEPEPEPVEDFSLDLEPEPVDSYVPPYVPDPPPESDMDRRVRVYRTKAPRWFRTLFLLAVALIVAATGSILHRQGYLERWLAELRGPDETSLAQVPAPASGTVIPGDVTPEPPLDPTPEPRPEPPPDEVEPDPDPVPVPPDRRLPDPGGDPAGHAPRPLVVETSDHRQVTLMEGEILVELKNGNHLKGRLHTLTKDNLRLAMAGGHVDVELSRLRSTGGPEDTPFKAFASYPSARVLLVTGEVLRGRLLESNERRVEIIFPSGKVVLRRDMVKYVHRR